MTQVIADKCAPPINPTSLTLHTPPLVPSDHEMMVYHTMAEQAVSSKMYKGMGEKAGVMMIMLAARELGIPPMQALNGGINIIQGKVEISARMMSALIRKAGHMLKVDECTELNCTVTGRRWDTNETLTCSFSVEEAKTAGIYKIGGGWVKWPKDMCFARALSRLARQLFSDVIGIGYVEGEIKPLEHETMPCDQELECAVLIEPITTKSELSDLLQMFDDEDKFLVQEYMEIVMKHFGWGKSQCISIFLKEKDIVEKFNKWKSQRKLS